MQTPRTQLRFNYPLYVIKPTYTFYYHYKFITCEHSCMFKCLWFISRQNENETEMGRDVFSFQIILTRNR